MRKGVISPPSRVGAVVEAVDQHAQARPAVAVEPERDAGQVDVVVVGDLLGRGVDGLDLAPRHDVTEIAVERAEQLGGRRLLHAEHEAALHEAL